MPYGLNDQSWELLMGVLIKHWSEYPQVTAWIFGSRARDEHQKFSDIDIVVEQSPGSTPALSAKILRRTAADLEESPLPYKVDLVWGPDLVEAYRPGVLRDRIQILST